MSTMPTNNMMGLLGDPLVQIGASIMAANTPGASFGQAVGRGLLGGYNNLQRIESVQQQRQLQGERTKLLQAQLAEIQREREEREKYQERMRGLIGNPAQMEQMGAYQGQELAGPPQMVEGQGLLGGADPAQVRFQMAGLLAEQGDPSALFKVLEGQQPKDLMSVSPGTVIYDPNTNQPIFSAPTNPGERKTLKGADGIHRYIDTGEPVFPGVQPAADQDALFGNEQKLRNEFIKMTEDFRKQNDAYGRIKASVEDPSAAGDLALIFNYMKLLDPGSVVRESEFATAENAAGVPARVRALFNKLKSGERLSPATRADFADRAGRLYKEASSGYEKRASEYTGLATRYNLDPRNVALPMQLYDVPDPTTPPPPGGAASPDASLPPGYEVESNTRRGRR